MAEEVWLNLDYDGAECVRYMRESAFMRGFRKDLFTRIVPTLKDIGLWGKKVQDAFVDMGVIEYAAIDPDQANLEDEAVALQVERELHGTRTQQ